LGIRERLGKIKERIIHHEPSQQNGNNGQSRTMTHEEVKKREYSPPKKARMQTTTWKPTPKESAKSRLGGYLERKAKEERSKKERRDERKRKLEQIESKSFDKGVEEYYRSKGRSEGYRAAKGRSAQFPILGEPGGYAKKLTTNINASPLMSGILGKQTIRGTSPQKSNRQKRPIIKVYVKGGKPERKRKKRKQHKQDIWAFIGL
jgi:hypothetical protein